MMEAIMLDEAIYGYLQERKSLWLKKKIKNNTPEEEQQAYQREADVQFSLEYWLPDAARRAGQLSLVSHPAKFSHPNAKTTSLIADCPAKPDGFLRSGNVAAPLDVLGNAAALDVEKFLSLHLQDGQTVLSHLEQDTEFIRQQLAITSLSYEEIRQGLLAIKKKESAPKTHGSVKQVYFPLNLAGEEYHLLSILMPSGILYELKNRINTIRFSEQAKHSREARKKNIEAEDYSEIYGLTSIGFGGTKPQNISVLNNQNGGVAYLLSASPPVLGGRRINPPRVSFFDLSYTKPAYYQALFEEFHKTVSLAINNKSIRNKIKSLAKSIFFAVIDRSWEIRYLEAGWSDSDRYLKLPKSQKLWLDQQYRQSDEKDEDWLLEIQQDMVRWFIQAYAKLLKDQAYPLADYEFIELKTWLESCGEGLK
jgi:CRISPR-associated protein Csy1